MILTQEAQEINSNNGNNFFVNSVIVLCVYSYVKLSNKITPSGVELLKLLKKEVTQGLSLSPTYVLTAKRAEVTTEKVP